MDGVTGMTDFRFQSNTQVLPLDNLQEQTISRLIHAVEWQVHPQRISLYLQMGRWFGAASPTGDLVGAISLFEAGANRWTIGNLIVHPAYHRQGVGTQLLQAALSAGGQTSQYDLIATPQGYPLYIKFGFRELDSIARLHFTPHQRDMAVRRPDALSAGYITVRLNALTDADMTLLEQLETSTGRKRSPSFYKTLADWPDAFLVTRLSGLNEATTGYALCLPERGALKIGPLVAVSVDEASRLLTACRQSWSGDMHLDASETTAKLVDHAISLGFVKQRVSPQLRLGGDSKNILLSDQNVSRNGPEALQAFALCDAAML